MKERGLMQKQLIEAWGACISIDYIRQRINSERSLQASFWAQLNQRLSTNRRLFIEPCISIDAYDEVKRIYPDIVICNTREIIGVVELKYLPQGNPAYQKDIKSLDLIARHRGRITVENHRFRGETVDDRKYMLSKNVLFTWAGIHAFDNSDNAILYSDGVKSLDGCYLQLHATTMEDDTPDLYYIES